jgi:hypothetical protein
MVLTRLHDNTYSIVETEEMAPSGSGLCKDEEASVIAVDEKKLVV